MGLDRDWIREAVERGYYAVPIGSGPDVIDAIVDELMKMLSVGERKPWYVRILPWPKKGWLIPND